MAFPLSGRQNIIKETEKCQWAVYVTKITLYLIAGILLKEPAPWGIQVPAVATTNTCFSCSIALYGTFPEQTTWYPCLGMDTEILAEKWCLFAHLAGNMAFGEVSTGRVTAAG